MRFDAVSGSADLATSNVVFPAGMIVSTAGSAEPSGWLLCDGRAVSRATYATLFAALGGAGTPFGTGDGSTTFNLPDFKGRTPIGSGLGSGLTSRALGAKPGEESHFLLTSEMPAHTHGANHSHPGSSENGNFVISGGINAGFAVGFATGGNFGIKQDGSTSTVSLVTSSSGGSTAHNNMQPALVVNFLIKT